MIKCVNIGQLREFQHRFEIPIKRGQNKDATKQEMKITKQRSFLLHKRLKDIVLRKDVRVLANDLPPKREFVIVFKMTDVQRHMYQRFLLLSMEKELVSTNKGDSTTTSTKEVKEVSKTRLAQLVLACYQSLQRIWNHPLCTLLHSMNAAATNNNTSKFDMNSTKLSAFKTDMSTIYRAVTMFSDSGDKKNQEDRLLRVQNRILATPQLDDKGFAEDLDEDALELELELIENGEIPLSLGNKRLHTSSCSVRKKSKNEDVDTDDENISILGEVPELEEENDNEADNAPISHDWWKKCNLSNDNTTGELDPLNVNTQDLVSCSNKMLGLLFIIIHSVLCDDKVVVFSQSINLLNVIELVLREENWISLLINENNQEEYPEVRDNVSKLKFSKWRVGTEYYRIDGSVSSVLRQKYIGEFNSKKQAKLFLISTKAGNMGVNLYSANRVIIFDSSWNPAHDLQAMFRCYRYGQVKPVFVYRFLAADSMEEKIYKRQVVKKALASRVIDEQTPDNHFKAAEQEQLLRYENTEPKRGLFLTTTSISSTASNKVSNGVEQVSAGVTVRHILDAQPVDKVLTKLVLGTKLGDSIILEIQDESVLLQDIEEEHLNDMEKQEAEDDYQNETNPVIPIPSVGPMPVGLNTALQGNPMQALHRPLGLPLNSTNPYGIPGYGYPLLQMSNSVNSDLPQNYGSYVPHLKNPQLNNVQLQNHLQNGNNMQRLNEIQPNQHGQTPSPIINAETYNMANFHERKLAMMQKLQQQQNQRSNVPNLSTYALSTGTTPVHTDPLGLQQMKSRVPTNTPVISSNDVRVEPAVIGTAYLSHFRLTVDLWKEIYTANSTAETYRIITFMKSKFPSMVVVNGISTDIIRFLLNLSKSTPLQGNGNNSQAVANNAYGTLIPDSNQPPFSANR